MNEIQLAAILLSHFGEKKHLIEDRYLDILTSNGTFSPSKYFKIIGG